MAPSVKKGIKETDQDLNDIIFKCEKLKCSIEKRECVETNQFFLVLKSKNKQNANLFKDLLEKCQQSAAIPNQAALPNIVIVVANNGMNLKNRNAFIFEGFDSKCSTEDHLIKMMKITFDSLSMAPFIRIGRMIANTYGPVQQRFSCEIDRHESDHKKIEEAIANLIKSTKHVQFNDFQLAVRAILCAKSCARCLVALLKTVGNNPEKFMKIILAGFVMPHVPEELKFTWVDESGEEYLRQHFFDLAKNGIRYWRPANDSTHLDGLGSISTEITPTIGPAIPKISKGKMLESKKRIKVLRDVFEKLRDENIKIGKITDFDEQELISERFDKNAEKMRIISKWVVELQEIKAKPIKTGNKEFDEELEKAVQIANDQNERFTSESAYLVLHSFIDRKKNENQDVFRLSLELHDSIFNAYNSLPQETIGSSNVSDNDEDEDDSSYEIEDEEEDEDSESGDECIEKQDGEAINQPSSSRENVQTIQDESFTNENEADNSLSFVEIDTSSCIAEEIVENNVEDDLVVIFDKNRMKRSNTEDICVIGVKKASNK